MVLIEFMMTSFCLLQLGVLKGLVTELLEVRIIFAIFKLMEYKITKENKMQ